ncbi:MAG: S-layer homology domain-containing protein [Candidatus Cohnella colombiensis]|uniref:S-layer homology domain-containing protein n=1 Tax=Candidatus Cohnella colombiensis TaxID=3121368 RepID=A0AA95EVI2_9BACL|nr:MAG: S-layer homology domain-containing protein [Cohnella sp.]
MMKISLLKSVLVLMIVLALTLGASSITSADTEVGANGAFTDVKATHWAKSAIDGAVKKGYVGGYPDGTFKPDRSVTRAEFMKMLVDALGISHEGEGSPWYFPYVTAITGANIHMTSDFTSYADKLSRMELSRLAVRAVNESYRSGDNATDSNFMVYEATKVGILTGVGVGKLELEGTTTRAQAVAIIERILSVKSGKKLTADKYAVSAAEILWHRTNIFTMMPEYFDEVRSPQYGGWSVNRLKIENAYYSAEVDELLAIKVSDFKDPNRKLLPALDKMQVDSVKIFPMPVDAYVVIMKYHVNYNKKPYMYPGRLDLSIRGFEQPEDLTIKKLVMPSGFRSLDQKYSHLNELNVDSQGNGIVVEVLPGSGFKIDKYGRIRFMIGASLYPGVSSDHDMMTSIVSSKILE